MEKTFDLSKPTWELAIEDPEFSRECVQTFNAIPNDAMVAYADSLEIHLGQLAGGGRKPNLQETEKDRRRIFAFWRDHIKSLSGGYSPEPVEVTDEIAERLYAERFEHIREAVNALTGATAEVDESEEPERFLLAPEAGPPKGFTVTAKWLGYEVVSYLRRPDTKEKAKWREFSSGWTDRRTQTARLLVAEQYQIAQKILVSVKSGLSQNGSGPTELTGEEAVKLIPWPVLSAQAGAVFAKLQATTKNS